MNDLAISKPVSFWHKKLSISPSTFFSSLAKAGISGATLDPKGVIENVVDALTGITPSDQTASAAWLLIYRALQVAFANLIDDYKDFLSKEPNEQEINRASSEIENAFENLSLTIDHTFFDNARNLPIFDVIAPNIKSWLLSMGMSAPQANAFYIRLRDHFPLALHQEWLSNPSLYGPIENAITSPFLGATKSQRAWMQYSAWLQEKVHERMFAEAFSLAQVYVPLRAYFPNRTGAPNVKATTILPVISAGSELDEDEDDLDETSLDDSEEGTNEKENAQPESREEKFTVVDLHSEIMNWIENFNSDHAIRVISGGPGSGKSSFAKMLAATLARENPEVPVLFIPLHQFNALGDLVSSIQEFIDDDRYLTENPLNHKNRLLLIFDGLDELAMQGIASAEIAVNFMDEVILKINKFNGQKYRYQALITGRELSVQAVSSRTRSLGQVIHVLPYYVDPSERRRYHDPGKLLAADQRKEWWKKYSVAKGKQSTAIPTELTVKKLVPITIEPLLNYLVALSYERKKIEISDDTTLNAIYEDLLEAVHERQWDHGRHQGVKNLEFPEFLRVLEEIALAVWHGDGRTASVNQIYQRCRESNLERHLSTFQEGAKKGITRLLTAFYFRQSEHNSAGDKTFEFTHKSFGEYLISKRIKRALAHMHNEITRHNIDPDTGLGKREALKKWGDICGPTEVDQYVYSFLKNEVASNEATLVAEWQATFLDLIHFSMNQGITVEQSTSNRFNELVRLVRNAEAALLVIHAACHAYTGIVLKKDDKGLSASTLLGEWIKRVTMQRSGPRSSLALSCFSGLDLSDSVLDINDFYHSTFKNSALRRSALNVCTFEHSNLSDADFTKSQIYRSNFSRVSAQKIKMTSAAGDHVNFSASDLKSANFDKFRGESCNFVCANLRDASFKGARLPGADFMGANLTGVDFTNAKLPYANFYGAKLDGAIFEGATVTYADFRATDLEKVHFGAAKKGRILTKGSSPILKRIITVTRRGLSPEDME